MNKSVFLLLTALVWFMSAESSVQAQTSFNPAAYMTRSYDFEASFTYPGLVLVPDDPPELDITLINRGLEGDVFRFEVEAPEGWTTELRRFNNVLTAIYLSSEDSTSLTLSLTPPEGQAVLPLGKYAFTLRTTSLAGEKTRESRLNLEVVSGKISRDSLVLSTSYPEIAGPSDGRFSFSLDIRNNSAEDALINLSAETPRGWDFAFKPGYEDKQISSIHVPKGQNRSVSLDVAPAFQAEAGSYQVKVRAEEANASAETTVTVNLSGTYKIRAVSANDLLSASAEVGRPVSVTLFVVNEGSASQRELTFLAVKPDDWEVTFTPASVVNLEPRSNPVQVEMTITPAANALVGDYGLGVSVQGEKAQSALDFRISVRAGSAWTWLGVLLIVMAVSALALVFLRLGRR
ncbi:MAG: hypothetical protein LBJ64_12010 [Deltaproteobacteria bacterium]|jgi:uncharacterized membrane protein|nr:hypothetical protein [Deltaproteobacteria bacterium]